MRILIFQTTRMGDMLQTTPLIRALRRRYPDAHIAVMVRPLGKVIAQCNSDIDEMFLYDEDRMFTNLRAHDSDRLLDAYKNADLIVQWMKDSKFDRVYNVTHSISSAMLLKLAGFPDIIGAYLSDDWIFVLKGEWTNYFFASVFDRKYNALNLCDITGRFEDDAEPALELVFDLRPEDEAFAAQFIAENKIDPGTMLVGIQLGASDEYKRWSVPHCAALARMLHERFGARILLFGVEEEAKLGDEFERHAPGLGIPLYGKTSIAQAAALLAKCRFLVTNDTGTMHVAAAVKCPVVLVSIGYVHFRETGPYGAGHVAIERRKTIIANSNIKESEVDDSTYVQPAHVMRAVDFLLHLNETGEPLDIPDDPEMDGVDLYWSEFAPDGCLEWYPAVRRELSETDFLRIAYRCLRLDPGDGETPGSTEWRSLNRLLGQYRLEGDTSLAEFQRKSQAEFAQLAGMAEQGEKFARDLLKALTGKRDIKKAKELVAQLKEVDEAVRIFGEIHPGCRPISAMARFERDNLELGPAEELAQKTIDIYAGCTRRAHGMARKCAVLLNSVPGTPLPKVP